MTSRSRTRWITVAVAVAVLAIVGAFSGDDDPVDRVGSDRTSVVPVTSPVSDPEERTNPGAPDARPDRRGAVARTTAALAQIPVRGRAPKTGYDRAAFGPAWTDNVEVEGGHNGCDTRNDILRRDLTGVTTRPGTGGCIVLTGVLIDPYTTRRIDFERGEGTSQAVQIDHVVALSDAWQKGAQTIGETRRRQFANDPLNLLAVDGPTNQRKGDADAASWLPPNKAFRCRFVALQTHVKARYELWMTRAEHDMIGRVLAGCTDDAVGAVP